ncbi:NDMA-dependent alcohol dehydrogenase [Mycobacterium syngnathidarum]
MKTIGALLWEPGTKSGWSVEEIELDGPKRREVTVKLAASGICHSDDHADVGDIPMAYAPIIGGHEGAGVVTELGSEVSDFEIGDHVVCSFLPSCGKCRMCTRAESSLCDLVAGVLSGALPDGTRRIRARGQEVGAFSYLGTFAPYITVPVDSLVKIDKDIPLEKAALIGCGVPTGWGSSVYAAEVELGDTVVVLGVGGVGMNAVQGARHKGAKNIVAVDPVEFKREKAPLFGATHTATDVTEAAALVAQLTNGLGADRVIIAVDVAYGSIFEPAQSMTRRGGVVVIAAASPFSQRHVEIDMLSVTMGGKRLQGSLYGNTNARNDIPLLVDLYRGGQLKLDELVTRTYTLEDINTAFQDLRSGVNIRGVIMYD